MEEEDMNDSGSESSLGEVLHLSSSDESGSEFVDEEEEVEEELKEVSKVVASSSKDVEEEEEVNDAGSEEDDEEEESEEDEDKEKQGLLRQQMKDLSFEELEELKQKMGLREFNEAMFGPQKKQGKKPVPLKDNKKLTASAKKKKKNRPMEVSSKSRVPKLRQVVPVPRQTKRDPRFDTSCGEFDDKYWNEDYSFLRDLQKKEADDLKTKIKSVDDKTKQKEIKAFIQRVNDKEKARVVKEREMQKLKQDSEENRKRVAEGKKPFYMKQSTKKLVELAEKYDELKKSGGLDKYLKKKRKRNAVRDRKTLK